MRAETPQQSELALARAKRTLSQTNKAVNQFLQLSAAESFVAKRQVVDVMALTSVLTEVLEGMALFAHQKNIDLGLEVQRGDAASSQVVYSDLLAIQEMVRNLVDNAIRYTPDGGVVTLYLSCAPQAIELRVEDTGPGVPAAAREKIFERFCRLDPSHSDGSGLGLAIVRELATLCGAELRIEEPSHGASGFCIVIALH
jgi:two-component system sensor histidine kinase TctE